MREPLQKAKVSPGPETGAVQEKLAPSLAVHELLQLQRTLGNRHVLRRIAERTGHAIGGRIVQRQPDPTADNVRAAIELLKDVSPISIHQYLSAVQLGGGSTTVETISDTSGGTAITSTFDLQLKIGALKGFAVAEFQGVAPAAPGGSTRSYSMTIILSPAVASTPPQTIAKDLYHEGLHMRLFVDRAVPKSSSVHLYRMGNYVTTASKGTQYAPLLADLAAYMQTNAKGKTPSKAQAEAKEIVQNILEEKYIIDETVRSGLSPKVPQTPADLSRNYQSLTTRWLVTYLQQAGVDTSDGVGIGSLAGKLRILWMEIDTEQQRLAQLPVLVPRSSGPPNLPPEPS